jgi:heavy metal sensor kinase
MSRAQALARSSIAGLGKIRIQLTLWYVLILAIILIAFSSFLYANLSNHLYAELDESLATIADREVAVLASATGSVSLDARAPSLDAETVVALYDPTGTRLVSAIATRSVPLPAAALATALGGRPAYTSVDVIRERGGGTAVWRELVVAVVDHGRTIGILQVAHSQDDERDALGQLALLMLIAIPLALIFAIAGGLFLAERALRPIDRITRAAAQISSEDLSRRLNLPKRGDEIGVLAETFDAMIDRMDRAFQQQRQFTADVSHELRTPLAVMIGQAEVALSRPRTAEEYRRVLGGMGAEAQRMNRVVGEMLMLARADAAQAPLDREPVDLRAVVQEVCLTLSSVADENGVGLALTPGVPVVVSGDQTRLTQLVVNLVDNALTYTPRGGLVTVTVEQNSRHAILRVADTGIGIAAEHLPHLFERFYRVDPSRSRAAGKTGLGLSICQWIVQAHGGKIAVESQPKVGTTFTVSLPLG